MLGSGLEPGSGSGSGFGSGLGSGLGFGSGRTELSAEQAERLRVVLGQPDLGRIIN